MKKAISALLASSLAVFAQTPSGLSGRVLDGNNSPIPFVVVKLASSQEADTTDSQGYWSLSAGNSPIQAAPRKSAEAYFQGKTLRFHVPEDAHTSLEWIDLRGERTVMLGAQKMSKGWHELDLSQRLPFGKYFLRLRVGSSTRVFAFESSSLHEQWTVQAQEHSALELSDSLVYSLQGQLLSVDQISSYRQYIEKYLQVRNVSGLFNPGVGTVRKAYAYLSGGLMTSPNLVKLGWIAQTNTYSGKVYSVMPIGGAIYDYQIYTYALDSLGHRSTQSALINFDSDVGDLVMLPAVAGNAYPMVQINAPAEISVQDSFVVSLSTRDSFAGQIQIAELRMNGGAWQNAQNPVHLLGMSRPGNLLLEARVMDQDSNWSNSQSSLAVIQDSPQIGIQGPSPLAINVLGDYSATVSQKYGTIVKYEWDTGAGYVQGNQTLSTKWLSGGSHQLKLRVLDDDSNSVEISRSINVTNDVPRATGLQSMVVNRGDQHTFRVAVSDQNGVQKVIWDFGHGSVANPRLDTTTRSDSSIVTHLWDQFGDYMVKMKVIDQFGNDTTQEVQVKVQDWFVDERDSKRYKQVKIGNQVWMAENLNYLPINADTSMVKCLNNSEDSCVKYGRLYNWSTALNLDSICDTSICIGKIKNIHQGVCPLGWHVPSSREWITLSNELGGADLAGSKMKLNNTSFPVWDSSYNDGNSSGFSAIPSHDYHKASVFWISEENSKYSVNMRAVNTTASFIYWPGSKKNESNVRCIQDTLSLSHISSDTITINDSIAFSANVGAAMPKMIKYEWDWENAGSYVQASSKVKYAWNSVGQKVITVRLTDSVGNIYLLKDSVVVVNDTPTVSLAGDHPTVNQEATFTANATDRGPLIYEWKIGVASNYVQGTKIFKNTWNTEYGTDTIFVRVTDEDGNSNIQYKIVQIKGMLVDARDSKIYKTVKIGNQIWMAENLNYGSRINGGDGTGTVLQMPNQKFCYFDLDSNCDNDGALYQWHTAMGISRNYADMNYVIPLGNIQGICPLGWHLPKNVEWDTLANFLGGYSIAGSKMKANNTGKIWDEAVHADNIWSKTIYNDGNSTGFSAIPAGYRIDYGGYGSQGSGINFWGALQSDSLHSLSRDLYYLYPNLGGGGYTKAFAFSVRCLKD